MPDLSPEECILRQRAVAFARNSTELSGGKLTPASDVLDGRFVAGELSLDEYVEATLAYARSLRAEPPVQEYFTSAAEAMNAARGR